MREGDRHGFVYVLCLDKPFSHARHYIGCTADPRGRMRTHARGCGANVIRAAAEEGIGFTVGAVGTCPLVVMRRLERQVKDWHNAEQFCEKCHPGGNARAIPGTRPYPLEALPFPATSEELARTAEEPIIEVGFADKSWLDADAMAEIGRAAQDLMQQEKHGLGWIPAGGAAGITLMMNRGKVIVALVDGQLGGYVAFSETPEHVTVNQCVTQDAYRRCGLGRRMIELLKRNRPGTPLRCKVREDLPANDFWTAIGFTRTGDEPHPTSGSRLNCYQHPNEVY